jgi:cytochrome d ubiquinol oxidase subunit II
MITAWFVFLSLMIAMYVVLDGFDLGAGALHRAIARTDGERAHLIEAIGPVWSGNEVWLIAAGGVLFLAFPAAYAAAFSGMYFGMILVLWLLLGRGLGLELRHHVEHPLWHTACDTVFWLSSAALAFTFGVALGNVVRGVPLGPDGYFHMPLFDLLNWYACLVGLFGLVLLTHHGALFLAFRARGLVAARARRWQGRLYWATLALALAMIGPTLAVREEMFGNLVDAPWRLAFPLAGVAALVAIAVFRSRRAWLRAFLASSAFLLALLAAIAAGLYPYILPAREGNAHGLTIHNAAPGEHALSTALVWWAIGIALAIAYFLLAYRIFFSQAGAHLTDPGGGVEDAPCER